MAESASKAAGEVRFHKVKCFCLFADSDSEIPCVCSTNKKHNFKHEQSDFVDVYKETNNVDEYMEEYKRALRTVVQDDTPKHQDYREMVLKAMAFEDEVRDHWNPEFRSSKCSICNKRVKKHQDVSTGCTIQ